MKSRLLRYIAAGFMLAAFSIAVAQAQKLKVFISVDMEGITGVVHAEQTGTGPDYGMARKWMTDDVNAAIQGALDAGATEIIVNDSHGSMRNVLLEQLNPAALLISGTPKPLGMMQGIDATCDAALFIGYHARAGTISGTLDHTISGGTVYSVKINNVEMPELGINALVAGYYNVPVVLVSGDKAVCDQTREVLGDQVLSAQVKEAIGRFAARNLSFEKARLLIRQQAKAAIEKRKEIKPYKLTVPYRFELSYMRSSQADNAMFIPGIRRLNARTIGFEAEDYIVGYRLLRGAIGVGGE